MGEAARSSKLGSGFHGAITRNFDSDYDFSSLHIIDLSYNNFSSFLPSEYFKKWIAMKALGASNSSYLATTIRITIEYSGVLWDFEFIYPCSVTIKNKGKDMQYERVQEVFTVIDLSSNRFHGDIPECMGELQRLQVLSLSNNMLTGSIPSSISSLTQLESLDLSVNKLSGKIPQQLVQLTFLASFNVSFNHLRGPIPQGSQFSTFDSSSYKGNAGLWGYPLESLNTPKALPPSDSGSDEDDDEDSKSWFKSNWITILPGFVGGLIFGVAIEHALLMDKREWFFKPLCRTDESTALLEFKDSFVIRRNASPHPLAYPKIASWSSKDEDDSCSCDGIKCDEKKVTMGLSFANLQYSCNVFTSEF
ncbi:Receptor-like protein 12 [Morus notabilis]|uniref:Receptor-like protein 12 n=1 Tax=Morus notabilis TaxID=981085 RepID=W9RZ52_9ROSA|nr:Receptor-like protein 12 [Morus notabilis]